MLVGLGYSFGRRDHVGACGDRHAHRRHPRQGGRPSEARPRTFTHHQVSGPAICFKLRKSSSRSREHSPIISFHSLTVSEGGRASSRESRRAYPRHAHPGPMLACPPWPDACMPTLARCLHAHPGPMLRPTKSAGPGRRRYVPGQPHAGFGPSSLDQRRSARILTQQSHSPTDQHVGIGPCQTWGPRRAREMEGIEGGRAS